MPIASRPRQPLARIAAVALAALGALAGACHDSDDPDPPAQAYVFGGIHLGGERHVQCSGAEVRAIAADGAVVATATITPSGHFALEAPSWAGFEGRIACEVALPSAAGGQETVRLARELRVGEDGQVGAYAWLGAVSTVASRLVAAQPQRPLAEAEAAVAAHLGIPAGVDPHTAFGESHRSPASWSSVQSQATAANEPLDAFLDRLVGEVGVASARSFQLPHPYPALDRYLRDTRTAATDGAAEWFTKSAEAERLVADPRVMVDGLWQGWVVEHAFGLISSGQSGAEQLLDQLGEIDSELDALLVTLSANATAAAWGYTTGIANPAVQTIRAVQQQFLAYTQGLAPDPQLAASLLQLRHQDLLIAVESLRQVIAGGPTAAFGPLGAVYARAKALERFGANPDEVADAVWGSLQLRDNDVLAASRAAFDYYAGWGTLGVNLLVEWAHLDPATYPATALGNANVQTAKSALLQSLVFGGENSPGWNPSMLVASQLQAPDIIASDDVLVDCGSWSNNFGGYVGRMMHKDIHNYTGIQRGNQPWGLFSLGPWSRYWIPMGLADYRRLRALAVAADPGDVNNGLRKLGFRGAGDSTDILFAYYGGTNLSFPNGYYNIYNFTTDTDTGNKQGDVQYCSFVYQRGAADDNGTIYATSYPQSLVDLGLGDAAARYESTVSLVDLTAIQPYGQAASRQFVVRDQLAWSTSAPAQAFASNLAPNSDPFSLPRFVWTAPSLPAGGVTATATRYTTLTASGGTLGCMPGATVAMTQAIDASFEAPRLASVLVVPRDQAFASHTLQPTVDCFATGFFTGAVNGKPAAMRDVTRVDPEDPAGPTSVVWSVSSPSGLASFAPGSNVLRLHPAQGFETMTITATVTMPGGVVRSDTVTCSTQFQ